VPTHTLRRHPLASQTLPPRTAKEGEKHAEKVIACCKSNDETTKARRYRFVKQSEERKTYPLPGTKEKPGRRR